MPKDIKKISKILNMDLERIIKFYK